MGQVYKITNKINNKSYIGYTTKTAQERYKQHIALAHSPNCKDSNTVFYKAIRKYGDHQWTLSVLYESDNIQKLKNKEQEYIKQYNTFAFQENTNGYNSTLGGDGVHGIQEKSVVVVDPLSFTVIDTFSSIKDAEKKYKCNVQETCSRKIKHHHFLIFYYKDEFDSMTQQEVIEDICNRVNIYCKISFQGELQDIFTNISEYCKQHGYHQGNITQCINGQRQSAEGFQWTLFQNKDKYLNKKFIKITGKEIPVVQLTKTGDFIQRWDSIQKAAKSLNKNSSHISSVCKGKRKTAYGYKWKYEEDYR